MKTLMRMAGLAACLVAAATAGGCGDDSDSAPWECWLGATDDTGTNHCACYQSHLEPSEGSPQVGSDCAESPDTGFLCCAMNDGSSQPGCTCWYPSVGSTNSDAINEAHCGADARIVVSCPPS